MTAAAGTSDAGASEAAGAELDGRPVTAEVLQALALTNFGHFTSMLVDDGAVRGLSLHLTRLVRDCRTVFGADLDPARVRQSLVRAAHGRTGSHVVRVTVFDPALELGRPGAAASPHLLVTSRPAPPPSAPVPAPLRLGVRSYQRELAAVKHVGLFGALHHRRAAQVDGFDDALFARDGFVSEGPTWNIGFFDGESVVWPKAEVLPGVTATVLRLAQFGPEAGPTHSTARVAVGEIARMRAAFVTNAAVGVRPVAGIDAVAFPTDHPVLDALRAAYDAVRPEPLAAPPG